MEMTLNGCRVGYAYVQISCCTGGAEAFPLAVQTALDAHGQFIPRAAPQQSADCASRCEPFAQLPVHSGAVRLLSAWRAVAPSVWLRARLPRPPPPEADEGRGGASFWSASTSLSVADTEAEAKRTHKPPALCACEATACQSLQSHRARTGRARGRGQARGEFR
jgi:hypothetical protein